MDSSNGLSPIVVPIITPILFSSMFLKDNMASFKARDVAVIDNCDVRPKNLSLLFEINSSGLKFFISPA